MLRSYKSSLLVLPAILLAGLYINTNAFADSNDVDFSITVNPSLTLALSSNTVNFSITPTAQGAYNSANFTVTSATNNINGYTLVMETSNVDLTSSTINPVTTEYPTIPTLAETQDGISAADFEASTDSTVLNHYGIAIGANNFNAMETEKTIKETLVNNASGVDTTTISLASKLDLNTVPGTYSTTFNFQMTANFVPITLEDAYAGAGKSKATIENEEYYAMQDMNSTICSNVTVEDDQLQVYDTRDDKIYWIAKLKDGHCWMTQNLDLDLSTTKKLTHADTDLGWTTLNTNAEWTPERDTIAFDGSTTTTVSGWTNSYVDPYSADPGTQYVVSSGTTSGDAVFYTLETCINDNTPDITTDDRTAGECSHYHTGNYYNWTAAIASNDSTAISTQYDVAPDSICPAGWRLSQGLTAETQTEEVASEWDKLLVAQGITSKWGKTDENIGYTTDGFKNIRHTPLFLVRAGGVYSGSLSYRASSGYYWSSSVYSSNGAYHLYFYSSYVYPSDYYGRRSGFAARCVAR